MGKTIVIAWVEDDVRIVRERRADLGERPVTKKVKVAKTCIWLLDGTPDDEAKAQAYAAGESDKAIRVFTFATTHKDPRGAAAKAAMSA